MTGLLGTFVVFWFSYGDQSDDEQDELLDEQLHSADESERLLQRS